MLPCTSTMMESLPRRYHLYSWYRSELSQALASRSKPQASTTPPMRRKIIHVGEYVDVGERPVRRVLVEVIGEHRPLHDLGRNALFAQQFRDAGGMVPSNMDWPTPSVCSSSMRASRFLKPSLEAAARDGPRSFRQTMASTP